TRSQVVDLFPAGSIDFNPLDGVRGTVGVWLDRAQTFGLEAGYMWFGTSHLNDSFIGTSNSVIGRPFLSAHTGRAPLMQVSSLNGIEGLIAVNNSFHLDGGDANFIYSPINISPHLNVLAGFRYLEMSEKLRVDSFSVNTNNGVQAESLDAFSTRNQFF